MPPHRRPRARSRGFTLIELMVVVVIIAVLAAIAVPLFAQRMRQRAVQQAAMAMAEMFRGARTRALGRGAAVMVTAGPNGAFTVFEGVKGQTAANASGTAACGNLPTRGCTTNNWGNVSAGAVIGEARVIGDLAGTTTAYTTTLDFRSSAPASIHVCFSPSGRAFVNQTGMFVPGAWAPLTDVLTATVAKDNREYKVVVLPNGTARLGL